MTQRKVAFITGSGKHRIGNAVAVEAAQRGYDVALHYKSSRDEARETAHKLRNIGVRADVFQADLSDPTQTLRLCEQVQKQFGRVDLLATCASIWTAKPLAETTHEDLTHNFAVNTVGTFLCCQKIGELMTQQPEGGSIVTFGDWAVTRPYNDYAAYFVSKGSIETMTRLFANELSRKNPNVRVNCIHPGPAMVPDEVGEAARNSIIKHSLVNRLGTPDSIVSAVFFFADNDFVTGSALAVDGGRTVSNH